MPPNVIGLPSLLRRVSRMFRLLECQHPKWIAMSIITYAPKNEFASAKENHVARLTALIHYTHLYRRAPRVRPIQNSAELR